MRTIPSKSSFGVRLKEKFEPYWTPSIEAAWRAFLGDFLNQDPQTYMGKRHTWTEGIDFIDALKIPGFRKSLTAMQLANTLAFALILDMPSLEEMAGWIWNHPGLGAYKGLEHLNFVLGTRKAVLIALTCFCEHLWTHCSEDVKQILHFPRGSVIAAEHFLCKVSRWERRIPAMKAWASDAERRDEWDVGTLEFAFPLTASKGFVQQILNQIQVSVFNLILHCKIYSH